MTEHEEEDEPQDRPIVKLGDKVRYVKNTHETVPDHYEPRLGIEGRVDFISSSGGVYVEFDEPANPIGDTVLFFEDDEIEKVAPKNVR